MVQRSGQLWERGSVIETLLGQEWENEKEQLMERQGVDRREICTLIIGD